jgi:hypothetical protein
MRRKDWFDFSAADFPFFTLSKQGEKMFTELQQGFAVDINIFKRGKALLQESWS